MTGYVRTDVTDQIANGNIIDAIPLDQEFDAITSAFANVGGHKHDGTVGEGAPITVVGPVQDLVVTSSSVSPKTDNFLDLGAVGKEFKNLYITGVANIDSLVADTVDLNGGTMDAVAVGAVTPSTGSFTTLATSGTTTLGPTTISGSAVSTAANVQTLTNKTINLANNTLVTTSAQLATAVTDETGTGPLVFSVSPALTGAPTSPTAAVNTNTTQIATTAFVVAQIADDAPTKTGVNATGSWTINAATATSLETPRTINGTLFSGAANITTTNWGTARLITIGSTGKSVDGSAAITWSVAEIGAQAASTKLTGMALMGVTPGIVVQTALDTFDTRTITASSGVSITNGSGAAGNPAISGVVQTQGVWDTGTSTTESVISPSKLATTIVAQKIIQSATTTTTAGTAYDFTGVPSTAKRITVVGSGMSMSAANQILIQLGTGGGIVTSGYGSGIGTIDGASVDSRGATTGFLASWDVNTDSTSFEMVITRVGAGSDVWVASVNGYRSPSNAVLTGGGTISLGAALTTIRVTRTSAGTFDAGIVAVTWE